jgi:hypothetical protein
VAFGQSSGPPASAKQVKYLESLLAKAGYTSWKDARRPLGLTQRQAGGRFTSPEASALIDRLLAGDVDPQPAPDPADARVDVLRGMPADLLAAELRRRGWTVDPPA